MSEITRWKVSGPATRLQPDADGPWVALVDYYRVIDRLIAERDLALAEVNRLITERDAAQAEMANGQAILDSSRPDDETIWREAFMRFIEEKNAVECADIALAQYRKRWPR